MQIIFNLLIFGVLFFDFVVCPILIFKRINVIIRSVCRIDKRYARMYDADLKAAEERV